ncbi:PilZ domain-containing protein [Sphingomonas sp. Leaf343]|uniref:PilZ domain-containing protein n=1 Tax=Sphingomonas sp. Leaf343 TaxID=1736345 RepID=UPI0006FB1075|nr:PilZ domain-containing protein [Sphingomonas sp. Leaf343]KQR81341.1 hypothetical protein ASG07_12960 [Sphingomonas sp. Leaf343]
MDGISRGWNEAEPDAPLSGDTDARQRQRDSLLLSAHMRVGDDAAVSEVRIRNLSAGGLMAEHPTRVATGTVVWLEMRGIGEVTGKVAWCAEGRLGIALDQTIDPQLARKPVGGSAPVPLFAKPLPRR